MAGDASVGFFSGVWSRLRAAAPGLRSRRDASGGGGGDAEDEGEATTVESRLARRAAAARRVGRKLAFVSFNLEVLVFVYAFWRARRRNLSWRQPIQALPMLVIPALATLIYAAFVRFTRTFDLKDKKMLERLQDEKQANDIVPSESDQNERLSAKKCDLVDDASNFLDADGLAQTSEHGEHQQPSVDLIDHGGDISWGHDKYFQPMHLDDLRCRTFSMDKTYMTKSSAFSQPISWSPEHVADDPEDSDCMQRTVEHQDSGADVEQNDMADSTAETSLCLPDCSSVHINPNAMECAECSPPWNSPKSNGGQAEEDAAQIALTAPKLELLHEGVEEKETSKFHEPENGMTFILEKELSVCPYAVNNVELRLGTSGFSLCSQENLDVDVAECACFSKVNPVLSSPHLDVEAGSEKESGELNTQKNDVVANSEEETLLGPHVVTETSGFSLRGPDTNMIDVNFSVVSPESNYPAPVESLAQDDEAFKDDETSRVYLTEQKGQQTFLDPLVGDSFEDSFATSELLSCSEVAEMTEVLGVVKEGMSEPQDEGPSNHQNDDATSSGDGGDTMNMMGDSVSVHVIPEANIIEVLEGGQETLSCPLDHSICHSARIILSSSEISSDEVYSSNSNSYFFYDNIVEGKATLAGRGGCSESKDEMNFAFLDTPILIDEVTVAESWTDDSGYSQCLPDSNRTQSLLGGKRAPSKVSESATFGLEESLIFPDQGLNTEIFSLYSRSSSCVSDVSMIETLGDGASPEQENHDDFSFVERNPIVGSNMESTESYRNNTKSAEIIPATIMIETPNIEKEANDVSEPEVSSNSVNSLKYPDIGNGMGKTDDYLDLETEDHGSFSTSSSHHEINLLENLQELPVAAGSAIGFPAGGEVGEWHCTVKESKDLEIKGMKEDVEVLDEDHENNPADHGVVEIAPALAQKPSVKLYAKDASW
ncbi:hypothetical protein ACP70R_049791 [Stipagrostis hirtigluma subsp. patula]